MKNQKHILVDGWNVIHSHPRLARALAEGKAELAQSELSKMLEPIHDYDGARVSIVYDGKGAEISIVRRSDTLTFSEVYTPSVMTADELIEQLCATSKNPQTLLIVTRDNLLRLTASSFGALSISPDKFFEWGNESKNAINKTAQTNNEQGAREWKKSTPFAKLDELALDIKSATSAIPLLPKRLRKKLKRGASKTTREESLAKVDYTQKVSKPKAKLLKKEENEYRKPIIGGKPASAKALSELKNLWSKKNATNKKSR